jgi:hydroxyacylglutathione hydrolase
MKPGQIIPVAGPVSLVAGLNNGNFPRCHGILIQDHETALIDPGCGREVLEPLRERVDLVLNTHTHPDHTSGNYLFTGSDILVPIQARESAGDIVRLSQRFTQPGALADQWQDFVRGMIDFHEYTPTGFYEPDEEIKVGRTCINMLHVPGHTVDHCCLYLPDHDLLISADVDFTVFGPWYGHRESDLALFRQSLAELSRLSPKITISSHREPLTCGFHDALQAFTAVLEKRAALILKMIQREQNLSQLVDQAPIYRRFPFAENLMRFWEGRMIEQHLDELIAKGKARRTANGFIAA